MTNQEQKIQSALADLIGTVERFYGVVPMEFLESGGSSDLSYYTFPKNYQTKFHFFDPFYQNLIETLDPMYLRGAQAVKETEKIVHGALPKDEKVQEAWRIFNDGIFEQIPPALWVGFYVGLLIGAKSMKASPDDLTRMAKGLKLVCLHQWALTRPSKKAVERKIDKAAKAMVVAVKSMRKARKGGRAS